MGSLFNATRLHIRSFDRGSYELPGVACHKVGLRLVIFVSMPGG